MFDAHCTAGSQPSYSLISRFSSCGMASKEGTISRIIRSYVPLEHGRLATANRRSSVSASSSALFTRLLDCDAVSLTHTSGVPPALDHVNKLLAVVATVQDVAGSDHKKLLRSSIITAHGADHVLLPAGQETATQPYLAGPRRHVRSQFTTCRNRFSSPLVRTPHVRRTAEPLLSTTRNLRIIKHTLVCTR